ncbi:MAG TPA: hypothetical protein VNY30_12380 [Bryobacteraceae bacterium]|nr:hypothetical protein [Bryobacteraceae bacterium]
MKHLIYILFGWGLTAIVSWCAGKLLLRRLSLHLTWQEEEVFAFLAGSACLGLAVFLMAALQLVYKAAFLGLSILVIAGALHMRIWRRRAESLPPLPLRWKALFLSVWLLFGGVYFLNALAPEASPDGTVYHLALVARYAREHGFPLITNSFFASLPQGMEMLFLFAFVWGRHSAAALVHCTYLLVLPWLILNYGRRIGMPAVGVAGGLLVFTAPVAGIAGTSAYNDVALAAVVFAVFSLLDIWHAQRDAAILVPTGLLAGFAFAIKYTGFVAAPYAACFAAYTLWRARKLVLRPFLLVTLSAAILIVPTLVKNWIVVRNPVSPFLNRLFPNPYVHVSFEEEITKALRSYQMHSPWEVVYETTTGGYRTGGLLGPVFLLAPLALLAIRFDPGRRLLLAALVFLLPYPLNLDTRFLLPAATFLAPGIAMGLGGGTGIGLLVALHGFLSWPARLGWRSRPDIWRANAISFHVGLGSGIAIALLGACHAFLSWPSHINWYAHRYAWRLVETPVRAAFRLESEDQYLSRRIGDGYRLARFIEQATPPGSRILTLSPVAPPAAYCAREILVSFYSALNARLCENLYAQFNVALQPVRILTFRFSPQALHGLRLAETGSTKPSTPSINEVHVFGPSGELQPARDWHLDARPFPWDVGLAFDRNPVTRWDAWQETRSGAWVEADFGTKEVLNSVRLETKPDQTVVQWELQGETAPRKWSALRSTIQEAYLPAMDVRRAAIEELKRNGIRYLLVDMPFAAAEFRNHAREWGISPLGEFGKRTLYHVE